MLYMTNMKIYIMSKWCDIRIIWYHITTSSMNKYYTMRKLRCADTSAWYYNYLCCKQPYMANMKIYIASMWCDIRIIEKEVIDPSGAARCCHGRPGSSQETPRHPWAAISGAPVLAKWTIPENPSFMSFQDNGKLLFYLHGRPEIGHDERAQFGHPGKTQQKRWIFRKYSIWCW